MRLNVSAWAIRRPIAPLVLFMVLVALGLFAFRSIAVTRLPNIDVPVVSVAVTQASATPAEARDEAGPMPVPPRAAPTAGRPATPDGAWAPAPHAAPSPT